MCIENNKKLLTVVRNKKKPIYCYKVVSPKGLSTSYAKKYKPGWNKSNLRNNKPLDDEVLTHKGIYVFSTYDEAEHYKAYSDERILRVRVYPKDIIAVGLIDFSATIVATKVFVYKKDYIKAGLLKGKK